VCLEYKWLNERSGLKNIHLTVFSFDKQTKNKTSAFESEAQSVSFILFASFDILQNNADISGELHIERLYLFSLIWSFGVLLDDQDRKKFGDLLLTLTTG
jgi:hypothetical protein